VFVRRAIRVARQIRDPEQLRSLFSNDTRAALLEAGFDPDSVSMQEIQESEELARLIASDLRRVLRSVVLGLPVRVSEVSPDTARLRLNKSSDLSMHRWSTRTPRWDGHPPLPPPIDQTSGFGMRVVVVLVIVGIIAAAFFVIGSQW
jgi:hypothetical protein